MNLNKVLLVHHATLLQAVNLASEIFHPHLQLPTDASDPSNVCLEGSFLKNLHSVRGKLGLGLGYESQYY